MKLPLPPQSETELMQSARELSGFTLGELAHSLNIDIPTNFKHHKGWTGQLIEKALGATAGSKPEQDFANLGIELKTLPLDYNQKPLETTYVCYAPLTNLVGATWLRSNVYNKLQKVLWIPVQGEREIPPDTRMIGTPILWQPNQHQNALLKEDWEELIDLITLGRVESITARIGQALQLRPKAANGQALTEAIGIEGEKILTRPRGFYLRKNFTQQILDNAF